MRRAEPPLPEKVNAKDLDPKVLHALETLNPELAEKVAKHLVMAGSLLDIDAEAAYAHAQAAASRASRVGEVREAAALAAYACGKYTEALREVRTARRLSGTDVLRAVEADCERGLGKPDRALAIIDETDTTGMEDFERAELVIVTAGARADLEQHEAALLLLDDFLAEGEHDEDALARVLSIKADCLESLGRADEASAVREQIPVMPEPVSIIDLEEVAQADTVYVASDLHGSRKPLAEAHDLIVLDLDGVCYQGTKTIPHAAESIAGARAAGTPLAFVTNNASRSPESVVEHLAGFGIEAAPEEIMTAAIDAVAILDEKLPPAAKVLVVGGEGLFKAVSEAGFETVTSAEERPAAVIMGYADTVGWKEMSEAAYAINAGALFVATNLDASLPTERGFAIGNGSLVACVQNATGKEPLAGGKPFPSIYRRPVERVGASRPLCVGDRLDTDIRGAKAAGFRALHVLTGVSTPREVALAPREERPDFVALDLRCLTQPHPGAVKNPTGEWTAGSSAGFAVDSKGYVTRDGERLSGDGVELTQTDYRAMLAAVWEARDNDTFVKLPALSVVDDPEPVQEAEVPAEAEAAADQAELSAADEGTSEPVGAADPEDDRGGEAALETAVTEVPVETEDAPADE